MKRNRTLGLVLSSQDHEAVDVSVGAILHTLEGYAKSAEVHIVPVATHETSGKRIHVRKIVTPQVDDKMVVKLSTLILPNTVNVKIFET